MFTYLFAQPVNSHCRFIYWWSNAGISTLGSVHHSIPWLSLWRTSGKPTNINRLCSSLSSTITDLHFLSLCAVLTACDHSTSLWGWPHLTHWAVILEKRMFFFKCLAEGTHILYQNCAGVCARPRAWFYKPLFKLFTAFSLLRGEH